MDRNALSSKRRQQGSQPSTKPPVRITRDKRTQPEPPKPVVSGRIKSAKNSTEIIRPHKRTDTAERPSIEDDPNSRHFTVANVGRNGTLYLKPSRMAHTQFTHALATPPGTSDGPGDDSRSGWPLQRRSSISGTYTPRPRAPKPAAVNQTKVLPPLSMANMHQRRRTRSHSFSTVDASVRSPTFDSNDFQILLNGKDTTQRPKSSIDLSDGLLNLRIPHYRIGTPRFSERGTAYLHNSAYTSMTDDLRSSVFSRGEWDKLFPTPRGGGHASGYFPRQSSGSPYLHPSHAITSSRTPPTPSSSNADSINATIYDRIEANINDPAFVRYSLATGRITAATPARLISQITSPLFLDYELLADFFLTFRNFLSCRDLMEYLLARMRWALGNDNDAGRIVRVRTFVAIRHWILNYFADDFLLNLPFRQRFCNLVNDLAQNLRQRPDRGGTDMNVIGELKKCWRRTCAMFWPVTDALNTSPEADILPGQSFDTPAFGASATSLPLSVRRRGSQLDFRRSSQIRLPVEPEKAAENGVLQAFGPATETQHLRTASIPTSPMSEYSLTVLSCSVPFLKHLKPSKDKTGAARPSGPQKSLAHEKSAKTAHGHKRSGSFSDALRDQRAPLPSHQPDSVDIQALPSIAMTGGLVRGLLLQPSPSKVDILIPLSPDMEHRELKPGAFDSVSAHERHQNASMKKMMGDVRRAISRKERHESPSSSHRSTNSSASRNSGHIGQHDRHEQMSAWQQLRGPPRVDRLGEKIEDSYKEAFRETQLGPIQPDGLQYDRQRSDLNRLNSHVTTGSRSIVIVDDTGAPELPVLNGALPSVSSWASNVAPQPLFRNAGEAFEEIEMDEHRPASGSPTAVASDTQQSAAEPPPLHDLLAVPDSWKSEGFNLDIPTDSVQARKSSNVHPSALDLSPMRHQLRKRPGGDLKAADYVHDLEPTPRPYTGDSYSTFSQAITSGEPSRELSGTHFSGQFNGLKLRDQFARERQKGSVALLNTHSSQPNMRPSFEKQVSHLAQITDNQHDGGIQDALAKLEGKASSLTATESTAADGSAALRISKPVRPPQSGSMRAVKDLSLRNIDSQAGVDAPPWSPLTDRQGASIYGLSGSDSEPDQSVAAALQEQRSTTSPRPTKASKFKPRMLSSPARNKRSGVVRVDADEKALEKEIARPELWDEPKSATPKGSFLLDDNESLSDISTEIADQSGDESIGVRSFFFDDTIDDDATSNVPFRAPPSPQTTEGPTGNHSRDRSPALSPAMAELRRPLKEALSAPKLLSSKTPNTDQLKPGELRRVRTSPSTQKTAHLPFVLAFDSDVIAEQMTIIEKDALDEVDWKDLISLNWQQSPCRVRNWVDFLKSESNGIDIVIARFNLVVNWVVSECILTEAPSERAKCITKYIHIATHCHRLRNYASMYQITLALLSSDISRLRQTWALVPPSQKQVLSKLEKLCQPIRNFHGLRSEMEAVSADEGCIPFIGLYTHDLMFNAQKPGLVDPAPPGKEKLINFERYQTAANIVKSLLRLIESSSKYIFRPHPEVLSRCLWLAALEDGEQTSRSKMLET